MFCNLMNNTLNSKYYLPVMNLFCPVFIKEANLLTASYFLLLKIYIGTLLIPKRIKLPTIKLSDCG